ncbi:MAG TPA: class I SAM-dependent methyltransferase [Phycisphaerae bacterium]|nr:class I SAM-dependent methyltransferase [Phycisphaerae bacterium]
MRDTCNVCNHRLDPDDALVSFPCHVRAFLGQSFRLWRCPGCRTIHCLDVVDLDLYYSKYPFAAAKLDLLWRIFYINLARRFKRVGLQKSSKLLDYGCANALFGQALRQRGYTGYFGYDPYRPKDGLGDPAILDNGPFDYILLQDVIEHVEDPRALLKEMDVHLAAGGHILVGTPNADRIDLARPDTFKNEVHAPYHLHIYTREALERFGREFGWTPVAFYDRSYHDRPWFGMNTRAAKVYQGLTDGTFDAFFDPFHTGRALCSPRFWFYAIFGYWLSYRSDMSIMFRKTEPRP